MNAKTLTNCFLLFWVFLLTQVCCGQASRHAPGKEQALKDVKVKSVGGWKEVVSDEGRFRILFPGDPVPTIDEARTMPGYKLTGGGMNWYAFYVDYPHPAADEAKIREDFRQNVEKIAKRSGKLVRYGDVVLNGKPGFESVTEDHGVKSIMRGFLVGSRLYTLEVDARGRTDVGDETPEDVRRFFDSFTFWE